MAPASRYPPGPVLSDPPDTFERRSKELDSHTKLCSNKVTKSASHLRPKGDWIEGQAERGEARRLTLGSVTEGGP